MLEEAKRTLAYICPVCGKAVAVERTAFQLAASVNHLPCPCGKSELVIEMKGDQCHVQVPCVFCGRDHKVACSTKSFLHEKVLAFSCSASGLDCLYTGEEEPVFRALSRLEEAVDRMVLNEQSEEKSPFLDELVMGEVLGELRAEGDRRPGRSVLPVRVEGLHRPGGLQHRGAGVRPVRADAAAERRHGGRY